MWNMKNVLYSQTAGGVGWERRGFIVLGSPFTDTDSMMLQSSKRLGVMIKKPCLILYLPENLNVLAVAYLHLQLLPLSLPFLQSSGAGHSPALSEWHASAETATCSSYGR